MLENGAEPHGTGQMSKCNETAANTFTTMTCYLFIAPFAHITTHCN